MINQYDLYDLINYLSDKERLLLINPRNGAGEIVGQSKNESMNNYNLTQKRLLHVEYGNDSFAQINNWIR